MLIRLLFLAAFGVTEIAPVAPDAAADAQTRTRRTAPVMPTRAQFEAGALRSGQGQVYAAMRRNFPAEYAALMDRLHAFLRARWPNLAGFESETTREQAMFFRGLMPDLRRAPLPDLMAAMQARLALLETAQRLDPVLCGRMAAASNTAMPIPAALQPGTKRALIAMIDAAGAGRRTPAPPQREIMAADVAVYEETFARFDPRGDLRPLTSGEESRAMAAPERLCRLAVALQQTVLALPPEVGREAAIRMTELALNLPRG
jgi:hypothetical protein